MNAKRERPDEMKRGLSLRLSCSGICGRRLLSQKSINAPDNAPRAADNEQWLDQLRRTRRGPNSAFSSTQSNDPLPDRVKKQISNRFPVEILSSPPDTQYIEVEAALANFTSIKYLQHFDRHKHRQGNFVDVRIIKCRSGNGGDGVVSFFRDAGRSIGPPDGGDGGDGGSVYVLAVEGLNSLSKLRTTYIASEGSNGASDQLDGARGKDILITVPVGTVIRWCMDPKLTREFVHKKLKDQNEGSLRAILNDNKVRLDCTGKYELDTHPKNIQLFRDVYKPGQGWLFKGKDEEYHKDKDWFIDLSKKVESYDLNLYDTELREDKFPLFGLDLNKPTDKPICLLKGGKGGLGNMHFLTNLIRNPRFAKSGRKGLEQYLMFELKSIADLGLVGLPNAGKSTILNRISNAKPRIGHWEFTTLSPTIGTIDLNVGESSFTVADIPGIVKDASHDRGMGLEFLRHIERSKGWVFVVSIANDDPMADLQILINELGGLEKVKAKNVLVVCNKADIECNKEEPILKFQKVEEFCSEHNWDVLPMSALKGENVDILVQKMAKCAEAVRLS